MPNREIIEPNPGDKRCARRDSHGHFTSDQTDIGKSSAPIGGNIPNVVQAWLWR